MADKDQLKSSQGSPSTGGKKKWRVSPYFWPIAVSLLVHFVGYQEIHWFSSKVDRANPHKDKIKMKVAQLTPKQKADIKKILEAKQVKTEKPEISEFMGKVNHKAKKQTKAKMKKVEKGADPGKAVAKKKTNKKQKVNKPPKDTKLAITSPDGIGYSALMPSAEELSDYIASGYQDYIDEALEEGDVVDINTTEYRFVGYFTGLRKAISLVWNYPYDAAVRGMEGKVGVRFTIQKGGSLGDVKIDSSSGYDILDRAILDAIKLAAPFAPLPEALAKEDLTIRGNFHYTLSNFISGY